MATVVVLNAARMREIEQSTIVSARMSDGNLIFTNRAGQDINVGSVGGASASEIAGMVNNPTSTLALAISAKIASEGGFSGGILDGGTF